MSNQDDCDELEFAAEVAWDSYSSVADAQDAAEEKANKWKDRANKYWEAASIQNKLGNPIWKDHAWLAAHTEDVFDELDERSDELDQLEQDLWHEWMEAELKAVTCVHKETTTSMTLEEGQ